MEGINTNSITTGAGKERRPKAVKVPDDVLRDFNKVVKGYRTKQDFYEAAEAAELKMNHSTVKSIQKIKECAPDTLERIIKIIKVLAA